MATSKLLSSVEQAQNFTRTENGAVTNASTLNGVLDFYYHAPARRNQDNTALFRKAFGENRLLAIRALFYVRDIRGGQGERETFRQGLRELYKNFRDVFDAILSYVPVYGRWDDIIEFVDDPKVVSLVREQLSLDLGSEDGSVSLLAKWMPSSNTSSKITVGLAHRWMKALGWTAVQYRKNLSGLRKKINLVETIMSQNQWGDISYGQIPSRAGFIYKDAFKRHDAARYEQFLQAVQKGEAKINAGTLYPYELVLKSFSHVDATAEAMWKCLPNYADTDENALVVADVSGSMCSSYGQTARPIDVCLSLAIYIAERNRGIFKDQFVTFSDSPKVQTLKGQTLYEKIHNLNQAEWGMSTNLQAVFDVVLSTAMKNRIPAEDMPTRIFIVSDMEFNACTSGRNFDGIRRKYEAAGYKLPLLVFWNVSSRNNQTPVTQDENGVYLVSGCSPSIFEKAVKAQAATPYEMMLEVLNGPRYEPIVL